LRQLSILQQALRYAPKDVRPPRKDPHFLGSFDRPQPRRSSDAAGVPVSGSNDSCSNPIGKMRTGRSVREVCCWRRAARRSRRLPDIFNRRRQRWKGRTGWPQPITSVMPPFLASTTKCRQPDACARNLGSSDQSIIAEHAVRQLSGPFGSRSESAQSTFSRNAV
jgi:hypothetical protein